MSSTLDLPYGSARRELLLSISDQRREDIRRDLVRIFGETCNPDMASEKAVLCVTNLHRLLDIVNEGFFTAGEVKRMRAYFASQKHIHANLHKSESVSRVRAWLDRQRNLAECADPDELNPVVAHCAKHRRDPSTRHGAES